MRIKSLSATSGYIGLNSFLIENGSAPAVLDNEEKLLQIFSSSINTAIKDIDFKRIAEKNTEALQIEARFGAMVTPWL